MSLPDNSTLYSPLFNFEFYNIYKNAQTSILNTLNHKNKDDKNRIAWYPVKDLPKDRKIICVLRDIYDRAISSYLYILKMRQMNIRPLCGDSFLRIFNNRNILNSFNNYLQEIKNNGFFDNHSLPQIYFLDNRIHKIYGIYNHMSKRDVNNLTHVLKFKDLNNEFKILFSIELRKDNTSDQWKGLKLFLKRNINLFKKDIEYIYREDLNLYNRFFLLKNNKINKK